MGVLNLNVNEKKLRDLYLRGLVVGEIQGPLTGKPSIDKQWLKYYSEDQIKEDAIQGSLYDSLVFYNQNNLDSIALNYYDNKISYKKLIDEIDKVASSFVTMGVKRGDKVTICMPYFPETVYVLYALSKIGAVANVIDPRTNASTIKRYINLASSRYIVMVDNKKLKNKIFSISEDTNLEHFITVSPFRSGGNVAMKTLNGVNKILGMRDSKCISFDKFEKLGHGDVSSCEYSPNEPTIIVYTSGTSGLPKGGVLTNDNLNSLALFQKQSVGEAKVGDKFLLIMPPFIAYGLVIGLHNQLCQGQELVMVPTFTLDKAPEMLGKLIMKYKPSYIMGVPNFVNIMRDDKRLENFDLSFLKGFIVGGDSMNAQDEVDNNNWLESHGAKCNITKGWGMTELSSCATYPKCPECNPVGSVGIPLSKNNIKILDVASNNGEVDINQEELPYDKSGELFASSPTMMYGYLENPQETSKVIFTDKDGNDWVRTQDIAHISENGVLYFENREKVIVVRPDGHNVSPSQIETVIGTHYAVKDCIVVGIPCNDHTNGSWPVACIVLKDEYKNDQDRICMEIDQLCKEKIPPRDKANYYEFIDKIDYTMNGKKDYLGMGKQQKSLKKARIFYK